ncbi:ABC transporter ATP-binding protein [Fusibacter sp. 3D3]|uniref:ABC transporter ATP-binding protein n=1 Tax=Fusibacter sp. 3D3 TaxID=1048380 RepID=UPI0008539AA3|nr:oligopeptide/dipeptide ABC transporter ATP-binding protein [Fusibacter sp. 3D3]GAU76667.1 oligopeptide transport ATP-binding protein OppF [Fusibacter sp. 3D3]
MSRKILQIQNLTKDFPSKKTTVHALSDVSFDVYEGETIGIVGESGCGKTTLGRCIVKAVTATDGHVIYTNKEGKDFDFLNVNRKTMKTLRKEIQMIFQNPYSSLDPRMTVFDIIKEPIIANYPKLSYDKVEEMVIDIASKVGLNVTYLKRYPHAFSGGQRQRIGIARALVLKPEVIVCDEAVSALDVSIQSQVINLLKDLQRDMNLTYLFISHDLSVVEYISDRVGVMYLGKMVEFAPTTKLFEQVRHPYTEALLSAVPIADPDIVMERIQLQGEIPNPANPPTGCYFHTRCHYCQEKCKVEVPVLQMVSEEHYVACHFVKELKLKSILDYTQAENVKG